jgi:hypothetical protein
MIKKANIIQHLNADPGLIPQKLQSNRSSILKKKL